MRSRSSGAARTNWGGTPVRCSEMTPWTVLCTIVHAMPEDGGEEFARLTLDGVRFENGKLPISALVELQRYERLVLAAARQAWIDAHEGEDLPDDFDASFGLTIFRVIEGSSTSLMERPAGGEYADFYEAGRDELERELALVVDGDAASVVLDDDAWADFIGQVVGEAAQSDIAAEPEIVVLEEESGAPDRQARSETGRSSGLPLLALEDFRDFGSSLSAGEELRIPMDETRRLVITPQIQERNFVPIYERVLRELGPAAEDEAPVERRTIDGGTVAGRLVMLNADRRNYTLNTLLHGVINGRYKNPELTQDLRAVLHSSAQAPVVRLTGRLRMIGDRLEKILEAEKVELLEIDGMPWSRKFVELASLPEGWAGDDTGRTISFAALDAARDLLSWLRKREMPLPGVFPLEDGGVLLEWASAERVSNIEISADAAYSLFDLIMEGRVSDQSEESSFRAVKRWLRGVLE